MSTAEINCAAAAVMQAPPAKGGDMTFVIMLLFIIGMYFLLHSSQRKRQKEHERMIKELRAGDEVMTTGGLFGTIMHIKADRFILKVADNTRLEVAKSFVQNKASQEKKPKGASSKTSS